MFIAWALMLLYPTIRPPRRAWAEELAIAAAAFALLPAVNALTTDRHLGVTIPAGDWALAGFDLTVLALGSVLGMVAFKVHVKLHDTTKAPQRPAIVADVDQDVAQSVAQAVAHDVPQEVG